MQAMKHSGRRRSASVVVAASVVMSGAMLLGACASAPVGAEGTGGVTQRELIEDTTPVEGVSAVLLVDGLGCPMCATNVDRQFRNMAGVLSSSVDLEAGEVTVMLTGQPRVTRGQLASAVYDAGFTVRGVRTP